MAKRKRASLQDDGPDQSRFSYGHLLLICVLATLAVSSLIGNFILGVVWLDRDARTAASVEAIAKERDQLETAVEVLYTENELLRAQTQSESSREQATGENPPVPTVDREAVRALQQQLAECDGERTTLEDTVKRQRAEASKYEQRIWELSVRPDLLTAGTLPAALHGIDAVSLRMVLGPDPRLKNIKDSIEDHLSKTAQQSGFRVRPLASDCVVAKVTVEDTPSGDVMIAVSLELSRKWRIPETQLSWPVTVTSVSSSAAVPPSKLASALANVLTRLMGDLSREVAAAQRADGEEK